MPSTKKPLQTLLALAQTPLLPSYVFNVNNARKVNGMRDLGVEREVRQESYLSGARDVARRKTDRTVGYNGDGQGQG
jgi:hypothetical protein